MKDNMYQHKCSICGELFVKQGKINVECQDCEIKRLNDRIKELEKENENLSCDLEFYQDWVYELQTECWED